MNLFHNTASAMSNYIRILRTTTLTAIGMNDWMDDCHIMTAGRLVAPLFQTWTDSIHNVFPDGWMQLNVMVEGTEFQGPSSAQPELLPLLFAAGTQHCGYASQHHFMLLFDNADLLQQLTWLLIGIADIPPLGTSGNNAPTMTPLAQTPLEHKETPPRQGDPVSLRLGSISLHIAAQRYNRLYDQTALTPVGDMPAVIRFLLHSPGPESYIGCSTHPTAREADAIPADGFCAFHSLWALDHPGQSKPPAKNRRYLSSTLATLCSAYPSQESPLSTARDRLLQQARLPRAHWPAIGMVAQ